MNKTILALSLTSALAATSVMAKNQPAVDFGMGATTAQKIQAMNAWATENGYHSQIINDNGTIKVRRAHYDDNGNLVRYEQWNIERELTDENGNFDHQKLENTLRYALSRAQKAGWESPNGVKPIDVIIEPVHPVSTKDKIKIVNKLLTASGLESRIEGTTLTFQHPDGFEVSIDLATASTEQLTKIKLGATEAFSKKIDQRRNNMPTIPESPIIDPIDGSKIIKTGAELVSELNKIATGGQGQTFINEYLQADADTKKKLASNLIDAANSDENLKRQLQQLTFEVPSAVNGEPQTITLYQFMDDIQNDVQDPIVSKITPKEIQLRGAGLNLLHAGNNLQQYGKNLHDKLTTKFAQADADFDNLIQKITVAEDTLRNTATKTQTQLITEFDTIDQQLAAITAITTNNTAAIDHNTDSVTAMIDGLKTARDATGNIVTMIGKEVQQTQQAINELTDGLIVTKDAASQILNQLNTLQNTNISNNTVAIGELTDGLKVARDIAADAITRLNALQNNNINANTDAIGQMIDGLKVARDVAATALTELNTRQNTTIDTNTHTINTLITELKIAKDAATDVITNAAIQMDATLSAHLSTKEQIARIELTKSKVQLLTAANNMDVQLTTTINNLQSQIDTINDQVGIPGPIDEGLIAGLERAKNDIEAELLKTNTKIDNNQSVFESFVGSLTTGLQTAKTEVESWFNGIEDATNNLNQAGHNAVDLLQTQRTNDIEKLSTYLNSASYNAQSALTNHLNGKEDNAKIALGEAKQSLILAAEYANNTLSDEITTIYAAITAAEQGSTEALDAVVVGLQQARKQLDANINVMNMAISANTIRMDNAKIALETAANDAELALQAFLSGKEGQARVELTTAKGNLQVAAINMQGQLTETFTQAQSSLTDVVNDLQAQLDRLSSGEEGTNPPQQDAELRQGLITAGTELKSKMAIAQQQLMDANLEFNNAIEQTNTTVLDNANHIQTLSQTVTAGTIAITTAGHNAVDLLQTQRTNDVEKLSTYLNTEFTHSQQALEDHLQEKENTAKNELEASKQELTLAAENANDDITNEIEAINSALLVNSARMDNAKIALETAANDAELALQAFLSGKEGQARVELTTAKGNLQVAAINMQGQLTKTFTQAQSSLTDVVNDLQAQLDRLSSGEEGTNPPQQDAELRQGLITAGTELKDKMAIAKQHLTDASDDINDAIAQTNTAVLTNTNNIQTLSQTVTAGTVAITTAAETLNQAGHNAVNLLQQQRTSDIEKLSTYLNSASYNAQRALTNHLNGKEDNAKIALGEAKQSLILAAEYANNTLSDEITTIYAAITAAEQGSTEALDAVVVGLQQARKQLDANINVMNMAISANTIRMDNAKIALETAANDAELALQAFLSGKEGQARVELTTAKGNLQVAAINMQGQLTETFTQAQSSLTDVVNDLQAQLDRLSSGEEGTNPPQQDAELRQGLITAGTELKDKMAIAKQHLTDASDDINDAITQTNTTVLANVNQIQTLSQTMTIGTATLTTAAENLNQAGHNAVDLLQTQRTNDVEKLSTYLNTEFTHSQQALEDHLQEKENTAKNELEASKQELTLAAENANDDITNEIEAINSALLVNSARMDNAKIALETAANDAELALQAFLSGKEGQARVELTTAKGNLQVAAINMQDQLTKTFTQAQSSLTDVVNDLQAQLDRLSSGEEGTNPPQQDAELRQGLITAGTELKDKMAIAKQHLTDASDDINDAIAQTNTAVLTNTNNIQTLSQTVTAGTVAITTAAETLNQAGHNAVNLLQQQRTSDIEKLSTYLNSASYNAQSALTNHLNGKEDNAKIALGEAKQSLILAAEYANNTLSGEINNIYAAITAAEQSSTEALNAVVTGLQQARDQLDTNFNVMNMAISANTIRMDSADIALTTAAQNLNQAGHNAVDLLQTQRTNDIEKLSTYLNSASYNAQLALTNHLDNKENNAKVALSKAKQSLTFAAEYANNALTGEINNIYAAITAAEQGSNEALDAVVVGLEVAKKQLKANLNVMNTAINSNAIRMDAGKAKLTEVASSAESQLMATIAALEERLDLLESTPDTVKATEEQQIALESGLQNAATVMIEKSQAASTAMVKGISNLKTAGKALKSHLQSDSISIASTSERQHSSSSSKNTLATTYITSYNNDVKQQLSNDYQSADATTLNSANDYTDQQVTFLNDRMDNLEADMDNVMATSQAVTAARPYLLGGQTSAIGVGLGGSGDAAAIAIGYAQRLNDNWTVNGNISGTQGNDVNVSVGVGASYAW